jgi:hypothetical protein
MAIKSQNESVSKLVAACIYMKIAIFSYSKAWGSRPSQVPALVRHSDSDPLTLSHSFTDQNGVAICFSGLNTISGLDQVSGQAEVPG